MTKISLFCNSRGIISIISRVFDGGEEGGLGLSISRKIMEKHGGFISVESGEGTGSTFSLYFPLK